ncbi:MAG: NAD(P)H-hydrate dehydratase [Desulfobacteraceae bacterium]|nr:MAG: NAD(P)H-hydrate dehydratase [Desulfobacteraceae bacterium]
MRLVKASEMQEMDRLTIQEIGIPGPVLMENAGRAAVRFFLEHFKPASGAHVLCLCGRGNNGGDGYVLARYLHQAGLRISVVVLAPVEKIAGDARLNLEIIERLGLDIKEVTDPQQWTLAAPGLLEADYIVDALLGTGLNTPVEGLYRAVIEAINRYQKPVMAIDIPSGVNADTGQIMGVAVRADLTVTFGLPKVGQLVFPGAGLVGRLVRADIGIPKAVEGRVAGRHYLLEPEDFQSLLQEEKADTHKGRRGHLLVLAGSMGKTGAATLAALGALRAGAGLVTVGIPVGLNAILEVKLTEAMTAPLAETAAGTLALAAEPEIEQLWQGKTALVIGPGLSTHPETAELVRRLVAKCPLPMVIDADGLNALAGHLQVLAAQKEHLVLTPHPGEMARLLDKQNKEVQADRLGLAARFAAEQGCCLALKGARTLIAEPGGEVFINPTGNPALAAGGSGDVLTGLIGGFLARGWPRLQAAMAGVYLHGLAADQLAAEQGETGILAHELLEPIPGLMSALARNAEPLASRSWLADLR